MTMSGKKGTHLRDARVSGAIITDKMERRRRSRNKKL
jgi:hypothetical protein